MTSDPWERYEAAAGTAAPAPEPEPAFESPVQEHRGLLRRAGGGAAAGGLILLKFLGKFAFLFKAKFLFSFLISAALYAWAWGWQFGVGFVILLLVHELGHVIQLRREGVDASAPTFIPFLGAFVAMKQLPQNAWTEAKVGLAGPVLGSAGALVVLLWAEQTDSNLLRALAYVGFLLNLINLVPVVPLDGGRAAAALHPAFWFLGLFMVALFFFAFHNLLALIVLALGAFELYRRWNRRNEPEFRAYHAVTWGQRAAVAGVYLGLVAALVVGMHAAYVTPPS
ncbi:MAG TPA: site-2 protease family protein [Gaiellales bacterium]|jgi:Zn-dependent protease|nr:site-2 protease family protein [Gaiellales bacterium]